MRHYIFRLVGGLVVSGARSDPVKAGFAHPGLERGAFHPQPGCSAFWTSYHAAAFIESLADLLAFGLLQREGRHGEAGRI